MNHHSAVIMWARDLMTQLLRQLIYVGDKVKVIELLDDPRVKDVYGSRRYWQMALLDMALRTCQGDDFFLQLINRLV